MLNEAQSQAFSSFYKSARHNGVFDEETTVLMHLVAGMAVGCDPCVEHYLKEAKRLNICADKIATAQAICMAVSAGRINAQVGVVESRQSGCCDSESAGGSCC